MSKWLLHSKWQDILQKYRTENIPALASPKRIKLKYIFKMNNKKFVKLKIVSTIYFIVYFLGAIISINFKNRILNLTNHINYGCLDNLVT